MHSPCLNSGAHCNVLDRAFLDIIQHGGLLPSRPVQGPATSQEATVVCLFESSTKKTAEDGEADLPSTPPWPDSPTIMKVPGWPCN